MFLFSDVGAFCFLDVNRTEREREISVSMLRRLDLRRRIIKCGKRLTGVVGFGFALVLNIRDLVSKNQQVSISLCPPPQAMVMGRMDRIEKKDERESMASNFYIE